MSDDLADWIAEDLWRASNFGVRQSIDEARAAWRGLPDREKNQWRTLAKALIRDMVP